MPKKRLRGKEVIATDLVSVCRARMIGGKSGLIRRAGKKRKKGRGRESAKKLSEKKQKTPRK